MSDIQKVTDEELVKWIARFKDGEPCPFCAGILPLHKFIIAIDTDAAGILIHRKGSCSGGDALLFAKTLVRERELIDLVLSSAQIIQEILVERKRP